MFKVIHTSDWHLGQHFYTRHRKNEHQQFLDWLLQVIAREQVNALVVAGDIFDTSTPPSYARELYNQFIIGAQDLNCTLIFVAGNHDSVAVLNESKDLLKHLNTHVISQVSEKTEDALLLLQDDSGTPGLVVTPVPFIRPRDVLLSSAAQSGLEKRHQLGEAIKAHYQQLIEQARQLQQAQGLTLPVLMTGHLSALGVSQTESVRDIYIGSLDGFPASDFPNADYIALGHIHKAQQVAGNAHICYSGAPIPLSFDELNQPKSINLVCFEKDKLHSVEPVAVPCFQAMKKLKGNLNELEAQISGLDKETSIWLSLEVTEQDFLSDLQQRFQQMTENTAIEILQITRARKHRREVLADDYVETLNELTPMDVFERRLALEAFSEQDEKARIARLKTLFSQIETTLEQDSEPDGGSAP
ncbi:exonuclease subunit SbcD [Planctobacterium marinum]|uniref:exonuclease subunit SbcD n=1 Tax=Planctobacterium marinum TaxID=1631968 RepID=UPI001E5B2A53|nr:exonuclease subunit SbcD [Planctobacterium marinum]MCC2606675.1 exonuclease subunit SbcD [Planctobacterium marinum]